MLKCHQKKQPMNEVWEVLTTTALGGLTRQYFNTRDPADFEISRCDNCWKELGMEDCTEHWGTLCFECFKKFKEEWESRKKNKSSSSSSD